MIQKIISGGQTGADYGGLLAGEELGIPTGGHCPKNCRIDGGTNPELVTRFGLTEHSEFGYPPRTEENVKNSDGTVIFGNSNSPGCRLTKRLCIQYRKPYCLLDTKNAERDALVLLSFINAHKINILNVAGNRESTNPGIEQRVKHIIKTLQDGYTYEQLSLEF